MDQPQEPTVTVLYGTSHAAHAIIGRAVGHLDIHRFPTFPNVPGVPFVPMKGDCLRFDEVPGHAFEVVERDFVLKASGNVQIVLLIEPAGRESLTE